MVQVTLILTLILAGVLVLLGAQNTETVTLHFLWFTARSMPLSLALLVMLRYAAPLRPTTATLTGSLAVAAITATALSLFHNLDATVMILIWNLGTTAILIGLASLFGQRLFSWVAPRLWQHSH